MRTGQWHVYVALNGVEHAVVYPCEGSRCDGCRNADTLFANQNAAYRYADRVDADLDAELAGEA